MSNKKDSNLLILYKFIVVFNLNRCFIFFHQFYN